MEDNNASVQVFGKLSINVRSKQTANQLARASSSKGIPVTSNVVVEVCE